MCCNMLQCVAVSNMLQCVEESVCSMSASSSPSIWEICQHSALHILQYVATRCSVLQCLCVACWLQIVWGTRKMPVYCSVYVAVCCSVLQCVAVCSSVHVFRIGFEQSRGMRDVWIVCYSVYVADCCSVLQYDTMCCSNCAMSCEYLQICRFTYMNICRCINLQICSNVCGPIDLCVYKYVPMYFLCWAQTHMCRYRYVFTYICWNRSTSTSVYRDERRRTYLCIHIYKYLHTYIFFEFTLCIHTPAHTSPPAQPPTHTPSHTHTYSRMRDRKQLLNTYTLRLTQIVYSISCIISCHFGKNLLYALSHTHVSPLYSNGSRVKDMQQQEGCRHPRKWGGEGENSS